MEKQYKYQLAVACLFRDAHFYLREFIEFHRLVGVEHFYLGNHLSADSSYKEILTPYITEGLVDLIEINQEFSNDFESQVHTPFFNNIISQNRDQVKWLACIDVDEFVLPVKDNTILQVLNRYNGNDEGGIILDWVLYGTSNIQKLPPNKLIIESFIMRELNPASHYISIKFIIRPDRTNHMNSVHSIVLNPNCHFVHPLGSGPVFIDELRINHYNVGDIYNYETTKVPFYKRYLAGHAQSSIDFITGRAKNGIYNELEDHSADKFIMDLRKNMNYT